MPMPLAAAAAAHLVVQLPPGFSSHACATASIRPPQLNPNVASQGLNPHHKWTIPPNHFLLSTSLPADSHFPPLTDKMSLKYGCEMKTLKHLLNHSNTVEMDPLETLNMIDAIQRLGIDYCVRDEIETVLQTQYTIATSPLDPKSCLHEVALRFRLLRQHGYFVPADVFESFMDKEGHLDKECKEDIEGLTSLYEASQLCLPEEDKLSKIGNLSSHMLKIRTGNLDGHLANYVRNTLANPFHRSLGKLLVKNYFGFPYQLQATNKWIYVFQQMAKLDFNRVQALHQHEISQLSQWWTKTGLSEELKFARDQPLKWYICSLAFLADPNLSEERIELTKSISFIYLIDDIYDLHGSLEDLRLFTKAIKRWDLAAIDNLPHSMKICYIKLNEMTNEICYKIYRKHGWNPIESLQKSWATLCDAFLVEAEWFTSSHLPSAEEYLQNGAVSSGVHVVLAHVFFLLGQGISKETVQLLNSNPGIVSSTATILRLSDDLGSAKDEKQEGYDGSYIEYYMEENRGVSVERTREHVSHMVSDAWKRLNQESLSPNPFPASFIEASQNIARFVPLLYGYDENQNLPTLEKLMKSVLYESVQI